MSTPSPHFRFDAADRITIRGVGYRWVETPGNTHILERLALPGTQELFEDARLAAEGERQDWSLDRGASSNARRAAKAYYGVDSSAKVGERVEIDECEVQPKPSLAMQNVLHSLSDDKRAESEKARAWICFAIDAESRCYVTLDHDRVHDSKLIRSTRRASRRTTRPSFSTRRAAPADRSRRPS